MLAIAILSLAHAAPTPLASDSLTAALSESLIELHSAHHRHHSPPPPHHKHSPPPPSHKAHHLPPSPTPPSPTPPSPPSASPPPPSPPSPPLPGEWGPWWDPAPDPEPEPASGEASEETTAETAAVESEPIALQQAPRPASHSLPSLSLLIAGVVLIGIVVAPASFALGLLAIDRRERRGHRALVQAAAREAVYVA
ncbi:hypothetical protein EMIHUDRAFT_353018, partial [Emiliania huxleyi CCMP1516]